MTFTIEKETQLKWVHVCNHLWFFGQSITFLWPFMGWLHTEHFGLALLLGLLGPWFWAVKTLDTLRKNKIKITQYLQCNVFISQFCLILPGFVSGTSIKGILSRALFFIASLCCCFSSMVFIGGGVRSANYLMACQFFNGLFQFLFFDGTKCSLEHFLYIICNNKVVLNFIAQMDLFWMEFYMIAKRSFKRAFMNFLFFFCCLTVLLFLQHGVHWWRCKVCQFFNGLPIL